MLRFIAIVFFIPTLLSAKELKPDLGDLHGCRVETFGESPQIKTKLKCDQIDFEIQEKMLDNKFLRWQTLKGKNDIYITLYFSKGVHGEKAIIFSKKKQKKLHEINSSWPIEVVKVKEELKLEYKIEEKSKYYPLN